MPGVAAYGIDPELLIPIEKANIMRATKNLGLAAAVVLALFVGFSAPAGATRSIEIQSGIIDTVLEDFNLAPGSQGQVPCPEKADTIGATTNVNGTWTLTGGWSGQFQLPAGSGNWYQADFVALAGSGGGWSGSAPTQPLTGTIGIQVRIYQLQLSGGPLTCAKTNLRCIISTAINVNSAGLAQSTYKGSPGLPTTTAGDMITITGQGNAIVSSCAPPFNTLGGTTIIINNLQAEVL